MSERQRKNRDTRPARTGLTNRLRRTIRRGIASRGPGRKGQGAVEFALALPIVLFVVMGIIDFAYLFANFTSVTNAAREGARYGATQPKDGLGVAVSAHQKLLLASVEGAQISLAYDSGPNTELFTDTDQIRIGESRIVVTVTQDLPTITPVFHAIWPAFHMEAGAARTIVSLGEVETPVPSGDPFGDGGGTAAIALAVTAEPMVTYSGQTVLFMYSVTNEGDVGLTDVTIVDSFGNSLLVGALAAGDSAVETTNQTLHDNTTNSVTATGLDAVTYEAVTDNDSVAVTVISPALELYVEVGPTAVCIGETATYTYTVENTGDCDLTGVTVLDSFGTPLGPISLPVAQSSYWRATRRTYSTTTNEPTAVGTDPLGGGVAAEGSATVILSCDPILMHEPLWENSTTITGTADNDQMVHVRDLLNPSFPSPASATTIVAEDGSFAFTGLPPLVAGHIIVVDGYAKWDSATVLAVDVDPIVIGEPLCHLSTAITGTAEPEATVTLVITGTSFQDATNVDSSGVFTFTLPPGQPLQAGQGILVRGYQRSDSAYVEACTADPYATITPQCGPTSPPQANITVSGDNWIWGEDYTIRFCWDTPGPCCCTEAGTRFTPTGPSFSNKVITVDVREGAQTLRVELWYRIDHAIRRRLQQWTVATFVSPCPAPDLVVTDLGLATTGPISTYQELDFAVTVANTGTAPINSLFWVDLYATEPTTQTSGMSWGALSGLGVGETASMTIRLQSGFVTTGTHQVWALADSWSQVSEQVETNNEAGPLEVDALLEGAPPTPPSSGDATIAGETWVSLAGYPVPHARARVWCVNEMEPEVEVASTTSDDEAAYVLSDLPAGTYTVLAETWIDDERYSGSVSGVIAEDGEIAAAIVIMYR
jgi:uncharacterized repeat protein (TIGR01451 family)